MLKLEQIVGNLSDLIWLVDMTDSSSQHCSVCMIQLYKKSCEFVGVLMTNRLNE